MPRLLPALLILLLAGCPQPPPRDDDDSRPSLRDDDDSGLGGDDDSSSGDDDDTGDDDDDDTSALPPPPLPNEPFLDTGILLDLADDIDAALADTWATDAVFVLDGDTGQVVYENDPDLPLKPASNTKLYTTAVAMDALGADHRLGVSVWSSAQPDASGAVPGDLWIRGGHDLSWTSSFYDSANVPPARLVQQLWDLGLREVGGDVVITGEYLVDGYQFGYFGVAPHRDLAADLIADELLAAGIDFGPLFTDPGMGVPAGYSELDFRGGPPLAVVTTPLNRTSHNEYADILQRHLGWSLGAGSSYDEGAFVMLDWLAAQGIDTTDLDFYDGSGLSHDNRVTARSTVELMRAMERSPAGARWRRSFSIAGQTGTLGGRMTGVDTAGRFWGKSGTLNGVITTSGYLEHRYDGHRYYISVLMNDTSDSNSWTRGVQNRVIEAVAVDRNGAGVTLEPPRIRRVRSDGDGRLDIRWDAVPGADYYGLWFSADGQIWERAEAGQVSGTTWLAGHLPPGTWHVRITAHDALGHSLPSSSYPATVSLDPPRLLLVDANDRYATTWENPLGAGHPFLSRIAAALPSDLPFDSAHSEQIASGAVRLGDYRAVFWLAGEESTVDESFSDAEQDAVRAYIEAGGALLASGSEIGWDLVESGSSADVAFHDEVLHGTYLEDDSGTDSLIPVTGGLFDGLGELAFYDPALLDVGYPDVLAPGAGGVAELSYLGGVGGTAAVSWSSDTSQEIYLGFPVEVIDTEADRAAILERVLQFFELP